MRKGAMPISSIRAIAPGASLQCIVLRTWWPVKAASTAISAVSVSRISPIMMMSGSWRRIEGKADFFFDGHLVDPRHLKFDRVFNGNDVVDGIVELVESGIQRGGLARAGGAGHQYQSVRSIDGCLKLVE